jgi:hypothetical protein
MLIRWTSVVRSLPSTIAPGVDHRCSAQVEAVWNVPS